MKTVVVKDIKELKSMVENLDDDTILNVSLECGDDDE